MPMRFGSIFLVSMALLLAGCEDDGGVGGGGDDDTAGDDDTGADDDTDDDDDDDSTGDDDDTGDDDTGDDDTGDDDTGDDDTEDDGVYEGTLRMFQSGGSCSDPKWICESSATVTLGAGGAVSGDADPCYFVDVDIAFIFTGTASGGEITGDAYQSPAPTGYEFNAYEAGEYVEGSWLELSWGGWVVQGDGFWSGYKACVEATD